METKYVVVHAGRRDSYQVPVAFSEVGRLEAFVTDYYSVIGPRTRRHSDSLPSDRVHSVPGAVAISATGRFGGRINVKMPPAWMELEPRLLGRRAAREATMNGVGLIAYSRGTAYHAFKGFSGRCVLFFVHPTPSWSRDILLDDAKRSGLEPSILRQEPDVWRRDLTRYTEFEVARADEIICASTFSARSLVAAGSSGPEASLAAHVVPYGCPPVQSGRSWDDSPHRFLFVGQAVQRKGVHHLLSVWPDVRKEWPHAELTMVTATSHSGLMPNSLPDGVKAMGQVSGEHLRHLMLSHHTLVFPSLVEGFGLVIGEALSHGMHVVASSNTGIVDLPADRRSSTIIEPGSRDSLKVAMLERCEIRTHDSEAAYAVAQAWQWSAFRNALVSVV